MKTVKWYPVDVDVQIVLNGEQRTVSSPLTIAELLAGLAVDSGRVVVERNLHIVPRKDFPHITLAEGDRLEILTLVSGG